ncbi:MAG: response regulator, partial [Verrucomicrobiales bacterium]|nr:response regulator [Verrucomicrobiales bacterium]
AGAEEAEGKIDAQEFDLLILDLNLPDRDGWDVLDHVNSCYPLLPVIIITGLIDQLDTRIIPGASVLLAKPVEAPALLKIIEELLATRGHRSQGDLNIATSAPSSNARAGRKRLREMTAPDAK